MVNLQLIYLFIFRAHRPSHPEEGKGLLSLFLPSSLQVENITLGKQNHLKNVRFRLILGFVISYLDLGGVLPHNTNQTKNCIFNYIYNCWIKTDKQRKLFLSI